MSNSQTIKYVPLRSMANKTGFSEQDILLKAEEVGISVYYFVNDGIGYDEKRFLSFGYMSDIEAGCAELSPNNILQLAIRKSVKTDGYSAKGARLRTTHTARTVYYDDIVFRRDDIEKLVHACNESAITRTVESTNKPSEAISPLCTLGDLLDSSSRWYSANIECELQLKLKAYIQDKNETTAEINEKDNEIADALSLLLANRPEINRAGLEASEVKSAPAGIEEKTRIVKLLETMLNPEHPWHSRYLVVQVCAWYALYADRAPLGRDIKQNDNSFKVEIKQWLDKHADIPVNSQTAFSQQDLSSFIWPLNFVRKKGKKYFGRIYNHAFKELIGDSPQ